MQPDHGLAWRYPHKFITRFSSLLVSGRLLLYHSVGLIRVVGTQEKGTFDA
jgi:hypothetical protein